MEPLPPSPQNDLREYRRRRAWQLHQQGWKQQPIADALGVTQGAVSQWIARAKKGGEDALRTQPKSGPPPRLSWQNRAQLPRLLERGPESFGFSGAVWTSERIAEIIDTQFGVRYNPRHVLRLLHACGWSAQKPICRAIQRDEAAIRMWQEERLPALKKGPTKASINSCLSTNPPSISCPAS